MTLAQPGLWPASRDAEAEAKAGCEWRWVDESSQRAELRWEPVLYLQEVELAGTRRRLSYPLKLEVGEEPSGGWQIFAPALGVGGFGASVAAALQDLFETVWSLWESFSEAGPDELHPSAIATRDRLARTLGL